jgi:8-oxo-dGTP diphosphatase
MSVWKPTLTHAFGAASVIVDDTRRVLLVKHAYGHLNWEVPGGIAESGESLEETARREVREELGVEIVIDALTGAYWEPAWAGVGGHHFVFRARLAEGASPRRADLSEIADLGWFSLEDLPRPISDFTVRRIRDALDGAAAGVHTVGSRTWLE